MGSGIINWKTDLYNLHDYIQNTLIVSPKDLFIESLRDFFSKDSYYHWVADAWGFPLTPDHTDLHPQAGLHNDLTTRLFIGESLRHDVIYYPAIIVKHGGSRAVPVSFNRERGAVQHKSTSFIDGYGNERIVITPSSFIFSGAYEGSIVVEVESRGLRSRDELIELITIAFVDTYHEQMQNSGVFIKPNDITISSPSESDDRNDKLFKQSVTFGTRTEWRREIPIESIVDAINVCVDFASNLDAEPIHFAPNLTVRTSIDLINALQDL